MIKTVLILVSVLLEVSGICELIHSIRLLLIAPKRICAPISVIWLRNGESAAQIRYAAAQKKWLGSRYADHIIAVDSGIDKGELRDCREIACNNGIIICYEQMLPGIIKSILS